MRTPMTVMCMNMCGMCSMPSDIFTMIVNVVFSCAKEA